MGCRKMLVKFSSDGLSEEEHGELLEDLMLLPPERPEHSLLAFLIPVTEPGGLCRVQPANAEIVNILGTTAPACQLIKTAIFDTCEVLIAGGDLGAADHLILAQHSPHLSRFVLFHMAGSRSQKSDLRELLILVLLSNIAMSTTFCTAQQL